MGVPEFIVVAILTLLIVGHKMLAEGIQNFKDAIGGGPQPPTHPLPGE